MLVLSRKQGERIQIGDSVEVTVLEVRGNRVRLGFAGPPQIPIFREEVHRRLQAECAQGTEFVSHWYAV